MSEPEKQAWIKSLTDEEIRALPYKWEFWARPAQLPPPGDWQTWLNLAGRGWGKTRTGAEWVRDQVESGAAGRIALVARTVPDARDVMVEGESGILAICPPWNMPTYEPSKRRLTWPNGAMATTYSADQPDRLRGPQHDGAWCDELAAWRYPDAWDQLMLGLRLGKNPRCVVTTTPRPTKIIKELVKDDGTYVTTGSTYDNKANMAPRFFSKVITKYKGTRLGRQELHADLLMDTPGALWKQEQIEKLRVAEMPVLKRIVVAIDPAVTSHEGSSETGIIAAGIDTRGHGYVIDDLSGIKTPDGWATRAITAYNHYHADRIIGEVNNGGDLVENTIRTVTRVPGAKNVSYRSVRASKGKHTRAEPVSALYEQGRIHHIGIHPELEDQQCTWVPGDKSPDRLDALVWAFTELMLGSSQLPAGMSFGSAAEKSPWM